MSSASIPGGSDYSEYWKSEAARAKHLRFNAITQDGKTYAFDVPPWALVTQFFGDSKDRMVDGRRPTLVFGDAAWWNHLKDLYSPLLLTYPDLNREIALASVTPSGQALSSQAWGAIAELAARKRLTSEIFTSIVIQPPVPTLMTGETVQYEAYDDVQRLVPPQTLTGLLDTIGNLVGSSTPPVAVPMTPSTGTGSTGTTTIVPSDPNAPVTAADCAGLTGRSLPFGACTPQYVNATPAAEQSGVVSSSFFGSMPTWGWVVLGTAGVVTVAAVAYAVTRPAVVPPPTPMPIPTPKPTES